ncbi:MAG: enoyl-CoA hydratase/isomerase family protein, partial [Myxococcaceae bacterium]
MEHVTLKAIGAVAEVTLGRGKVNALDERLVDELADAFRALEADPAVRAVVLTGRGAFFSFGFDVPHLVRYSKEEFIAHWLERFTGLYRQLFSFPKPLVAALNGHTVAGGCMLALTADLRLMVPGTAKIALNELTFGSSVFAGA